MLHWAYWHYRAVGVSLISDWVSMSTGEDDLEVGFDADFDFGILDGWLAWFLATFGDGSLKSGMAETVNSCVALVVACCSLRPLRIDSFCCLASSDEKLLWDATAGWGGVVIA